MHDKAIKKLQSNLLYFRDIYSNLKSDIYNKQELFGLWTYIVHQAQTITYIADYHLDPDRAISQYGTIEDGKHLMQFVNDQIIRLDSLPNTDDKFIKSQQWHAAGSHIKSPNKLYVFNDTDLSVKPVRLGDVIGVVRDIIKYIELNIQQFSGAAA